MRPKKGLSLDWMTIEGFYKKMTFDLGLDWWEDSLMKACDGFSSQREQGSLHFRPDEFGIFEKLKRWVLLKGSDECKSNLRRWGVKTGRDYLSHIALGIISDLLVNFDATGKGIMENMYLKLTMWHLGNKISKKVYIANLEIRDINFIGFGDKLGLTWFLTSF